MDVLSAKIAEALSRPTTSADPEADLGIEARSILRSIETEATKLQQFDGLSRTDRHYFRARFNYYKLSILRLRENERDYLEPKLIEFHQKILQREFETGSDPSDVQHAPFLEAVKSGAKTDEVEHRELRVQPTTVPANAVQVPVNDPLINSEVRKALLGELALMKMALKAEPTHEGQRILSESIDRIVSRLKG